MRRALKFLHSLAACGMIGALAAHAVVLAMAPQDTPQAYAAMRQTLSQIASLLLLPSMAVALLSGLLAMIVHYPFAQTRWAWAKAALGLGLFEATLGFVQSKGTSAAEAAMKAATAGEPDAGVASLVANEWWTLCILLALSLAQVALGVWRPRLGAT